MNLNKTLVRDRVIDVGAMFIRRLEGAIACWEAKLDQDAQLSSATSK